MIEDLDLERVIRNIFPQQEVEVDYNDLYDRLFTLYSNPIDLNRGDRERLQFLFFLTEEQISGILSYHQNHGEFLTICKFQTIQGFDESIIQRLIPFVTIDHNPVPSLKTALKVPKIHDLFLRHQIILEVKKDYTPADTSSSGKISTCYAGDPSRLHARSLYAKPGLYSFGFTIEKDPGETMVWDPSTSRYGMDYYSFHAMIANRGILKKVIVGDYSMDFGQGLVFGSELNFGKGIESIPTIRRNNLGLRLYRSVYEDRDFSGVATSISARNFEINASYSYVNRDAIIKTDSSNIVEEFITSIQTVGLHRTPQKLEQKIILLINHLGRA